MPGYGTVPGQSPANFFLKNRVCAEKFCFRSNNPILFTQSFSLLCPFVALYVAGVISKDTNRFLCIQLYIYGVVFALTSPKRDTYSLKTRSSHSAHLPGSAQGQVPETRSQAPLILALSTNQQKHFSKIEIKCGEQLGVPPAFPPIPGLEPPRVPVFLLGSPTTTIRRKPYVHTYVAMVKLRNEKNLSCSGFQFLTKSRLQSMGYIFRSAW